MKFAFSQLLCVGKINEMEMNFKVRLK